MEGSAQANGMTSLLKRHGFVIAGVALPLLVVVAFAVARTLPRLLVDDPRYDLVYSAVTGYPGQPHNVNCEISSVDGRVRARWSRSKGPVYSATVHVYRLHPATGAMEELETPEPKNLDALEGTQDLFFAGLDGVRLDTSPRAPDGYEFDNSYSGGSGVFGGLFYDHSRGPRARIKKDGRVVMLPRTNQAVYGYDQVTFIGWVIPVEGGR